MSQAIKRLLTAPLGVVARALDGPLEHARRAWAYSRTAAKLRWPVDPSVVILGTPEIRGSGNIRLGRDLFLYRDLYLETKGDGHIEIGDGVVMSRGVHVVSFDRITVGDGSMVGEYASLRDANHRVVPPAPIRTSGHDTAPIRIGRNVWIGRGATILAGVTIGDHAVVGAGAVVTRDVATASVVVGVPAREMRRHTLQDEHHDAPTEVTA